MTPAARPRRLLLLLCATLVFTAVPVLPVVAEEEAPETKLESLGDLEEDGPVDEWRTSKPTEAPIPFTALTVNAPDGAEVQVRTGRHDGTWSDWEAVEPQEVEDGPDPGTPEDRAAASTAADGRWTSHLVWVSEADLAQVMVRGAELDEVGVDVIDSMGLSETLFERVARRVLAQVRPVSVEAFSGIRTRSQWGADESWRKDEPRYATPRFAVLHHTATRNDYSRDEAPGIVRAIYRHHTHSNGWNDIGYNFLVDRFGTVYEGRYGGIQRGVIGAHAANYNTGSFGVSIIGNFEVAKPTGASVAAATEVIAWKYSVHDIDPNPARMVFANNRWVNTLSGHRDVGSTACPGRYLYQQFDDIRHGVYVASAQYGTPPTPVVGDWNGDGRKTVGWFRNGEWVLRNSNSAGSPNIRVHFGTSGDLPVVGDWNGNGVDNIGVVRNGRWLLKTSHSGGAADIDFYYGRARDYPLPGDWNGNGRAGPGIVRDGEWHLRNSLSGGRGQIVFTYGRVTRGDIPVAGDWNGNRRHTPGILRDGEWHLRNTHSGGPGQHVFVYGRVTRGDVPIVGDWNRSGRFGIGVTRGGQWHLRNTLSGGPAQLSFTYHFQ